MEVTEEAFDEVYRVNLKAAMFLAQATARHQVDRGGKAGAPVIRAFDTGPSQPGIFRLLLD